MKEIDKLKETVKLLQDTIAELETFCQQLCKEQREICAKEVSISDTPTKDRVINALMPQI